MNKRPIKADIINFKPTPPKLNIYLPMKVSGVYIS